MADHAVVPERDFQAALDLIVEYGLDVHDKNIKPLLEDAGLPGPHQAFAWDCLLAKLAPFREYHATYPFRVPLTESLGTSPSSWLRTYATDYWLPWRDRHATSHAALAAGKVVKAWDLKSDMRDLALAHDFFIIGPTTVFLPLARVPYLTVPEQASITIDAFKGPFFLAENANQVLYPALLRLWEHQDRPSIKDLHDLVVASTKPHDTFNQKDAIRRIATRLQRVMTAYPNASTSTSGPSIAELNDQHVYVDGSIHLDATAFLILLFSEHLYTERRATGRREWTTVIVGDEANLFAGEHGQTVDGTSLYHRPYQLFRGFGINVTLGSSNRLDPSITTNAGTIVVLPSPTDTDYYANLLRLNPKQTEYLARMPMGECLVRLNDYPDVIHAKFDPINAENYVRPEAWKFAAERHNPPQTTETSITHEPTSSTITPSVIPPNTTSLPSPEPSASPEKPVIALNRHEKSLLTAVAEAGVSASTPAYKKAGLSLAFGDTAARMLTQKGLILRERIVLKSGRGGHGVGLVATPTGLSRVNRERLIRTRGGDSVQHQYLVQELHRALPGSTVEGMVGTKAADLLMALNTEREADRYLITYLASKTSIALNTGDLVALEVETSDPGKTAKNNIIKNHAAGITLTLILVLPKAVNATRAQLATSAAPDTPFVVLDVLDVIHHLSGRKP
jgi:hypothetical protein